MGFYTYILASGPHGTLYTGSTDDLPKRIFEHKERVRRGFTAIESPLGSRLSPG